MERARIGGFVTGRVQGVGYRVWSAKLARRLGLAGWVRNLVDGRVEFTVQGPKAQVDAFLRSCEKGPPFARVDGVETIGSVDASLGEGFKILADK